MTNLSQYFSQIAVPEFGLQGQQLLSKAKVLVIGAGGLGCPVLSYLNAMGTGTIGIADADTVKHENLHRQVLYAVSQIGEHKVLAAQKKLQQQNPDTYINIYAEAITASNAKNIMSNYDVIIDCTDNIATRYIIDDIACALGKPWVYGAVLKNEGQVSVFNYKNGPCFKNVFFDATVFDEQHSCAVAGIMPYTTGVVGCLQVNEAVKIITNNPHSISGSMLTINLQTMQMRRWKIKH